MALLHVVVATNQFRVGGRETFVATLIRALRPHGVVASLLCSDADEGLPETRVFDRVVVCSAGSDVTRFRSWLQRGGELLADGQAAVLWAQHFDLLPAWLLSRRRRLPLVTTFHGPVVGAGRPNGLMQALGMTLAVQRGDALTGVSHEVLGGLASLRTALPLQLTLNAVEIGHGGGRAVAWPPRHLLLVTRDEKLDHLRAGVRVFAAYRRRVPGARLRVVTGAHTGAAPRHARGPLARAGLGLRVLGARWCRSQGVSLLASLPFVDWSGYEPEPRRLMRAADLVLGMGRVLVEALAEGRPALLVGYEHAHGLLTPETLERSAGSNFSGRGLGACEPHQVAEVLLSPQPQPPDVSAYAAPAVVAPLEGLLRATTLGATTADFDLAAAAVGTLEREGTPEALFRVLAGALDERERESLYRLTTG